MCGFHLLSPEVYVDDLYCIPLLAETHTCIKQDVHFFDGFGTLVAAAYAQALVLVSRPSSMADNDKVSLSLMLGLVPELSFVANIVTRIRIRIVAYLVGELVSCLSSEVLCHLLCTCCRSLDLRLSLLNWLGDGEAALQQ